MKSIFPTTAPAFAMLLAACGGPDSSAPAENEAATPETTMAAEKTTDPAPDLAQLGRRYFTVCAVCHATTDDAQPRQGPNLKGVYGAPAARLEDYRYSEAMRAAGLSWTEKNLDAYIENPQKLVPGNNMAFAGEKRPDRRRAILAYLKSLSDDAALEQ
ncbi:MAG: c-type cytochrome [Parvularculaceae bacterium]